MKTRWLRLGTTVIGMGLGIGAASGPALADSPIFAPPHGMLRLQVDANNKVFSNSGVANFDNPALFSTNALGQTILTHNVGGTGIIGGIAERDGNAPLTAATPASTILLADDPGVFADAGILPADTLVSFNYFNSLRYFAPGGTSWGAPASSEQLRVFDLTNADETGGPAADLEVIFSGTSAGALGTINIGMTETIPLVGSSGVHGHVGYELMRTDGSDLPPAVGAYMIELTLSAKDPGGLLQDSDPIFVVFNNQMGDSDFAAAVSAAQALPEPTTAVLILASVGLAAIGIRQRRRCLS